MRAAVLGSPIAHSLSPVLHRAVYAELGLDWTYEALDCSETGLAELVRGLGPDWAGLSLTMPLKAAVLPLLDESDDLVRRTGAANTVVLSGVTRVGANTDVPGLVAALQAAGVRAHAAGRVTVLGGGATARSTLVSLADAGYGTVDVVARRPEAARGLPGLGAAEGVRVEVHGWSEAAPLLAADLVVSTVPAGAADTLATHLPTRPGVLFDVVYDPWPTVLASAWAATGGRVVGGLELLLQQAALQVKLMTGTEVPAPELVAVMRAAAEAEVLRRTSPRS